MHSRSLALRPSASGATLLLAAAAALLLLLAPLRSASAQEQDIVDTAVAAGSFSTLATALEAADLVETLKGPGPYTVFAPTDAAFEKLPPGTVDALLQDREKLRAVLLYHVVEGRVTAADVSGLTSAPTVGGPSLRIDASNGVKINDATVTQADVMASNGVIHVIDTVLLPPSEGGAGPAAGQAAAEPMAQGPGQLPNAGSAGPDWAIPLALAAAVLIVGGVGSRLWARSR